MCVCVRRSGMRPGSKYTSGKKKQGDLENELDIGVAHRLHCMNSPPTTGLP